MNRKERRQQAKAAKKDKSKTQHQVDLGIQLAQQGRTDEAIAAFNRAVKSDRGYFQGHYNIGVMYQGVGKLEDAVAAFRRALSINPDYDEALNNLGLALGGLGRREDAVDSFRQALSINPDFIQVHNNLGLELQKMRRFEEAVACFRSAIAIETGSANIHNNLGLALQELKRYDEAKDCFVRALSLNPNFDTAHFNLGNMSTIQGKYDDAVASYNASLSINPGNIEARNNLGNAYKDLGRLDDAVACFNKSISINPDFAATYNGLAGALMSQGKNAEALEAYQKALAIDPNDHRTHSNLLLAQHYQPGQNAENLYDLHQDWDQRHGEHFRATWPAHLNSADPERILRIGFVSPDLGRHPVGYFIARLFENISRSEIETVVYSEHIADDLTDRIKAASGIWNDVEGISDEELSAKIVEDQIDILFDLTGHSAKNRLCVFARKPAPLQVSWAGYVGTTGLAAMDFLLSDIYSTPKAEEQFYSEKILRMPDGWLCYDPPTYAPKIGPLPFEKNGTVTFCSFCTPEKINDDLILVWSKIMGEVSNSRLLFKYNGIDSTTNVERLSARFDARGIDTSRLIFEGQSPHGELLARYNDVDLALDPFPYSGGLTTYEALWMGVPVITIPGQTFASRHSQSHLSTLSLPELVAGDRDEYVRLAVELSGDVERMTRLRAELRGRMANSPICDGEKFAANFTSIMRKIWHDWCASK